MLDPPQITDTKLQASAVIRIPLLQAGMPEFVRPDIGELLARVKAQGIPKWRTQLNRPLFG